MMRIRTRFLTLFILMAASLHGAIPAAAHPHAWVGAKASLRTNASGQIVVIHHVWSFDEMFSAYAKQGLDSNQDGRFSREELQPLAHINVTSLEEFHYFTRGLVGGKPIEFSPPTQYWLEEDAKGNLILHFDLPLKTPAGGGGVPVIFQISDPEYWVAMELTKDTPVTLIGDGKGCIIQDLARPQNLNATQAQTLAQIPSDVRQLPPEYASLTQQLANRLTVICP